jgi:hypothetical protein
MASNVPCADGCDNTTDSVAQVPAEAEHSCRDGCCGDEHTVQSVDGCDDVSNGCKDACCSSQTPSTSAVSAAIQLCQAAEFPSCCSGALCRAPTAPLCCSPQVHLAPSPHCATAVSTSKAPDNAPDLRSWRRAALLVSAATVVWNMVEGGLSVGYGARDISVSLLAFGADSWIEVLSAVVVAHRFWRQEVSRFDSTAKEKRATLLIGSLLLFLAVCILGGSVSALSLRETPDSSLSGIAISSAAIGVMTALYLVKMRIAAALSSSTMQSDAQCSLCCIQLSSVLFVGSLVSHYAGDAVWWFDGATALVIALLVAREGYNAVRNARRPDFNGCSCCDDSGGWYMRWLRKRQQQPGQ